MTDSAIMQTYSLPVWRRLTQWTVRLGRGAGLRSHARAALVSVGWVACLLATRAAAQDPFATGNPFGVAGAADQAEADDKKTPAGAAPATAAIAPEADPLVRLLRSIPPKTPTEYAENLQWMVRQSRWDEVGRYLDLLKQSGWSREQLADVASAGAASLWFQLRSAGKELTADQQKFVQELAALPAQLAKDVRWIDGWIDRLANPSPGVRREAQLRLLRGGSVALGRLNARLLSGDARVPGRELVEAILQFDAEGVESLRAATTSRLPEARGRVLLAIAESSSREFSVELASAVDSEELPKEVSATLRELLIKRYGKLPDVVAIRQFLLQRFQRQLADYQLVRASPTQLPVAVWRVASDGLSLETVETSGANRSLERLAQLARHCAEFGSLTSPDWVDMATTILQQGYQSQPGVATADPSAGLSAELPEGELTSDFLQRVLKRSAELQMHGASIRAAQAIGRELPGQLPGDFSFDFIAGCLRDSRPVMRYVGLDALAKADMKSPYNGSASALETAVEMSRLGSGPMVLVVGLTADLRLAADQQLVSSGAQSISVHSTQAALKILDEPYPIELIMIVDRVPHQSLLTLVDRLRHSRRGGSLPIAILTEELEGFEVRELERIPGLVMSVLSQEPSHMPRLLADMERRLDTRPLNAEERGSFAETARGFLARIAENREQYQFYPLARWEKELQAASSNLPTDQWLAILSGLGTIDSQERLLQQVADLDSAESIRTLAAQAFTRSVQQFGLLLRKSSQLQAYEVYNSHGPQDPVTVSVLGQVLDAIETRTGKGAVAPVR